MSATRMIALSLPIPMLYKAVCNEIIESVILFFGNEEKQVAVNEVFLFNDEVFKLEDVTLSKCTNKSSHAHVDLLFLKHDPTLTGSSAGEIISCEKMFGSELTQVQCVLKRNENTATIAG